MVLVQVSDSKIMTLEKTRRRFNHDLRVIVWFKKFESGFVLLVYIFGRRVLTSRIRGEEPLRPGRPQTRIIFEALHDFIAHLIEESRALRVSFREGRQSRMSILTHKVCLSLLCRPYL